MPKTCSLFLSADSLLPCLPQDAAAARLEIAYFSGAKTLLTAHGPDVASGVDSLLQVRSLSRPPVEIFAEGAGYVLSPIPQPGGGRAVLRAQGGIAAMPVTRLSALHAFGAQIRELLLALGLGYPVSLHIETSSFAIVKPELTGDLGTLQQLIQQQLCKSPYHAHLRLVRTPSSLVVLAGGWITEAFARLRASGGSTPPAFSPPYFFFGHPVFDLEGLDHPDFTYVACPARPQDPSGIVDRNERLGRAFRTPDVGMAGLAQALQWLRAQP